MSFALIGSQVSGIYNTKGRRRSVTWPNLVIRLEVTFMPEKTHRNVKNSTLIGFVISVPFQVRRVLLAENEKVFLWCG